jgi:uncharacterized protein (DUF302 family)
MTPVRTSSSLEIVVDEHMVDAEAAVRAALASEGFGVLTEIDVAATLRDKLGVHHPPLKILGACNPLFAHRALELDPAVALVLPCNVVIEGTGEGRTRVAVADPRALIADDEHASPELEALSDEAATALERAVARLRG